MNLKYSAPTASSFPVMHQCDICQASLSNLNLTDDSDLIPDYGWNYGNDNDL